MQAVAFLEADAFSIDNSRNTPAESAQYGQDRHEIRTVLHINRTSFRSRRYSPQIASVTLDPASHRLDKRNDRPIALQRMRPQSLQRDGSADYSRRKPERGLRIISFKRIFSRPVPLVTAYKPLSFPFLFHIYTVPPKTLQRNVNVTLRFDSRRTAQDGITGQ